MNRLNNVPFSAPANPRGAAPAHNQMPGRLPKDFMEAMKRIPGKAADNSTIKPPEKPAKTRPSPKRTATSSACKWKSSFKPLGGEEDDDSQDSSTSTSENVELYNPYEPDSSDSEVRNDYSSDQDQDQDQDQDNNLERLHLSSGRGCLDDRHWEASYVEPGSRLFDRHDLSPEPRPRESRGHSSGCRRALSPPTEPLDRPEYGSIRRPLDHRVRSPDRIVRSPSTQEFPASYRGQKTNGEERIRGPEHRREITTTVRLTPPRLQHDYKHQLGLMEKGLDHVPPATERTRNRNKNMIIDNRNPISCELCCVQLANGQELEDHLDSRSHWGTLEYIQQNNDYDDLSIAFLQDVMLYKSGQCSRAIEDSALQALQENDHMTKVEMFHCAACNLLISTSASAVQTHITSQEHLSNTKEFEVQQRRTCLEKAGTIINELKPQFEHFIKGDSTSECWE